MYAAHFAPGVQICHLCPPPEKQPQTLQTSNPEPKIPNNPSPILILKPQ